MLNSIVGFKPSGVRVYISIRVPLLEEKKFVNLKLLYVGIDDFYPRTKFVSRGEVNRPFTANCVAVGFCAVTTYLW